MNNRYIHEKSVVQYQIILVLKTFYQVFFVGVTIHRHQAKVLI